MEDYGIGAATKMSLLVLQQASRRSGRTMRLIERVGPGDRIIVETGPEARRLERLLRDAGKEDVSVQSCSPNREDRAWMLGTNRKGITLFEAGWVEQWYLRRLEATQDAFATMQGALSKDRQAPAAQDDWSLRFDAHRYR